MFRQRRPFFPILPFKSIQSSISLAFSLLILATIAVTSLISYRLSVRSVEINSQSYIEEVIKQVNGNIQSYIDNMENISLLAMTNKDVKYYISSNSFISDEDRRPYEKRISDLFQAILYTRKDIASIMVFGYNGRYVSDRRITTLDPGVKPQTQDWYVNAQKQGGQSVISAPHVQNLLLNESRSVVSLSRELKSTDGITAEGIFLVDLNLSVINDICSTINLGKQGYVFIVDNGSSIVYHPERQSASPQLVEPIRQVLATASGGSFMVDDNEGNRMYTVQDTNFGWKIVGVAYTDDLIANKGTIRNSIVLYSVFGLAICLLLSLLLSHRLSRPIKNLQRDMKKVEKGNFEIQTEIGAMNEIGQLGRTFNMMVGQTRNLMQEMLQTQENKRKSELQLLQAQINPHFLYNTLDSIVWMAEQKQHEEVVLMTSALAKLFRASITKDKELVPIGVEIEHITNYLLIQKMRYDNQLDYVIEVPETLLDYLSLKILLQPFVENAIYHGIRHLPDIGLITIRGKEMEDRIVFEVEDNGNGMTPQQLEQLWAGGPDRGDNGIGISNVNERIKLYFGDGYGVHIRSELEEGTCVMITIPKMV
ncbi:sensor histidine kinase [Paenibacillus sepulcri]|uniref:histidine kinase n=1 Tax=Paenibacillus sepulcri TaxID=359917 RepID=A0ABS7C104_9BACL|nr:histidine kinase [Paenibacillus sepulcri]